MLDGYDKYVHVLDLHLKKMAAGGGIYAQMYLSFCIAWGVLLPAGTWRTSGLFVWACARYDTEYTHARRHARTHILSVCLSVSLSLSLSHTLSDSLTVSLTQTPSDISVGARGGGAASKVGSKFVGSRLYVTSDESAGARFGGTTSEVGVKFVGPTLASSLYRHERERESKRERTRRERERERERERKSEREDSKIASALTRRGAG